MNLICKKKSSFLYLIYWLTNGLTNVTAAFNIFGMQKCIAIGKHASASYNFRRTVGRLFRWSKLTGPRPDPATFLSPKRFELYLEVVISLQAPKFNSVGCSSPFEMRSFCFLHVSTWTIFTTKSSPMLDSAVFAVILYPFVFVSIII